MTAAEFLRTGARPVILGGMAGALTTLFLISLDRPWLASTASLLLALCLLLVGEGVRSRWDGLSRGLVAAAGTALTVLALILVISWDAPEGGYPLLLAAAAYVFLRLGLTAGMLVASIGVFVGSVLLHEPGIGQPFILCLAFVLFSRSVPSRPQILGLMGVCALCAMARYVLPSSEPTEFLLLLPLLVIVPWMLHFGSQRPWRWTWIAALLALGWLRARVGEGIAWPAWIALAFAAGFLLLAIPLARQLARDPGSTAVRLALEPLLGAAVVAIAFVIPLGMEPRRLWLGALLAVPLLIWVDRRLKGDWLWLPTAGAAIAAIALFVKGGP